MTGSQEPTEPIRQQALTFADVTTGKSCNQSSYKVGKGTFLFIGPGAKGIGYKAMFKLKDSISQATQLAEKEPKRFEVSKTGWVTTRFTEEEPLSKRIWKKWLLESYNLTRPKTKK